MSKAKNQQVAETQPERTGNADEPRRMLTEAQVLAIVPVGRSTLWRAEKEGKFPRSTYISPNRRVWYADEVAAWQRAVDERIPNRGRGPGRPKGKRSRFFTDRQQTPA